MMELIDVRPALRALSAARDSVMEVKPLRINDETAEENVIRCTTNYGMFRFDAINRPIREKTIDHICASIQDKKNLLHLFPIVVNRRFEIMDGQHRFEAARRLGVPIYYIVSSQMTIEDAAEVVRNVSAWSGADFLHHWCALGLPDYLQFKKFWEENKFLTFSIAMRMLTFGGMGLARDGDMSIMESFRRGRFVVVDLPLATRVASMSKDFGRWIRFWRETPFIGALLNVAANPAYDHNRMMQKMEYLSARLVKCPDIKTYLRVITEIYNYKVDTARKVYFEPYNSRGRHLKHDGDSTPSPDSEPYS